MTTRYANQQIGVLDSTKNPATRADGRQVGAKKRAIIASNTTGSYASGDTIVLGELPAHAMITRIEFVTDTSLGSSTISIGIPGTAAKYTAAATFTTPTDKPTVIGPKASILAAGPVSAKETLIATIGAATMPSSASMSWIIEYVTNN